MKKRPEGENLLTDVLLPYLLPAVFLGGIVYALLKWLGVF